MMPSRNHVGRSHLRPERERDRSCPVIELRLRSPLHKCLFLTMLALPMLFLIAESVRLSLAQTWGASFSPATIQRGISLDPANPDLYFELGKILLLTGDPATQLAAEREFRTATNINPNPAQYWLGLGKACYSIADQACADSAFLRAQQLAPSNPQYAWEAAVNDVVSNRPEKAIAQLKTFVALQPEGVDQSFQLLMRGFGSPAMVWNDLLVPNTDVAPKIRFLSYLTGHKNVEVAQTFWRELAAEKAAIPLPVVTPYIDQLLATEHYQEAQEVWMYSIGQKRNQSSDGNLVFNGGFEQLPMNAAFDWRFQPQPFLALDFADGSAETGGHALRVDFTVPQNSEYEVAYQFVPVQPDRAYDLTAMIRSNAIKSDSGPRLRVVDPLCEACLNVTTEGTIGTTDWHQISANFTTGPTTDMIRLSIWRPRSRSYPMEISGQAWFDDISLHPLDKASSPPR